MKIYYTEKVNKLHNRSAITFVEMMVAVVVASLVFGVAYNFMSDTRHNYMYGTVNLQNLQEARLAINYLRSDFASACPLFVDPDETGSGGYQNLQKVRKQLFVTGDNGNDLKGELMQVHQNGILFHKFVYGSYGEKPRVEAVAYTFDGASKTLIRQSQSKGTKNFSGFENVEFALYTHEINPGVPVLWVKFRIHESSNMFGSDKIGNALELTTTISSPFVSSSLNNKYWRYETGHEN